MTSQGPGGARILAAITFHFDARRLVYLAEVLHSLAEFPVEVMDVVVVTNSSAQDELGSLRRLCAEVFPSGAASVSSHSGLSHPFDLAWCHKALIAREFGDAHRHRYTHFIYLEDDIRLSFRNFSFVVEYRERLRGFGLLPSFVRVEYSAASGGYVSSDAFWPVYVPCQAHLCIDDSVLINMPNPYLPCFVLDRELATEYLRSDSFDRERSQTMCAWGVRERSALGLCLENVPPRFQSRYVVPISRRAGTAPAAAWIRHLPNNYANNPRSPLGKIRMDRLFGGMPELKDDGRWPTPSTSRTSWIALDRGDDQRPARAMTLTDPIDGNGHTTSKPAASVASPQESTADGSDRYYLVSHHDTVLFADMELMVIRHAPFGLAPLNLVIEIRGEEGRLLARRPGASQADQLSFRNATAEISPCAGQSSFDCQVEPSGGDQIGIRIDGQYLSADHDGFIRNDRTLLRSWEQFRLVSAQTLDGIAVLRDNLWLSHADRRIVALGAQPFGFGREHPAESSAIAATVAPATPQSRGELVFGPARIRLGKTASISFDAPLGRDRESPIRARVLDTAGTAFDFSRFAPLVHYRMSGDVSAGERLRLSLVSLEKFGCYTGNVAVDTRLLATGAVADVPQGVCERPMPRPSPHRGDDRFTLIDGPLDAYQPVLVCSESTVFDADITAMLSDVLLCEDITPSAVFDMTGRVAQAPIHDRHPAGAASLPGATSIAEKYCRLARAGDAVAMDERCGLVRFEAPIHETGGYSQNSAMRIYLDTLDAGAHVSRPPVKGRAIACPFPGPLGEAEVAELAGLARAVPAHGCVVEIGPQSGQSSWVLASNLPPTATIYCIEAWDFNAPEAPAEGERGQVLSIERFRANMAGYSNITPLQGSSPWDFVGWQRPIRMLVVNRVASGSALRPTMDFWSRCVHPGGVICGPGYSDLFPGVKAEVDRMAAALGTTTDLVSGFWSVHVPSRGGLNTVHER